MRVYDGESSSNSPEPKPTSNFCDAYLTYLNSGRGKPADYTGSAAQGSSEECGLLRIGLNGGQSSKWTFYNRSTSQQLDRRSESTSAGGTHFTRGTSNCLTRHLSHRRMGLARHHALKGSQDLRREFTDRNHRKGINLKGKSSNSGVDSAKTKLGPVGVSSSSGGKCLKVTLKQISMNDSWLKLGNNVFKIPKSEGNAEGSTSPAANLSRVIVSEIPSDALSEVPSTIIIARTVGKLAAAKDQSFDQHSDQPVSLNDASEELEECVQLKDSGPEFPVNDLEQSIDCTEGLCDRVELTQPQSDESRLLQEEKLSDCIELSIDETTDVTVISQDKPLLSDSSMEQKLVGVDKQALDVQQVQGLAEVSERLKFSSRSLRSGIRHQCGTMNNDSIFKNSWRKKLIKKHLVSEKFKTQASRRLNAERPKRNIGQRKNGEASGLSRQEEVDLNRALYASLQLQRQKNKPPSTSMANPLEDESTETSYDGVSNTSFFGQTNQFSNQSSFFNSRSSGLQAQRKFASVSDTAGPSGVRRRSKRAAANSKILVSKKARTEDFLTFLCLRAKTTFPSLLDFVPVLQNPGTQVKLTQQDPMNSTMSLISDATAREETVSNNIEYRTALRASNTAIEIPSESLVKTNHRYYQDNIASDVGGKKPDNQSSSVCLFESNIRRFESQEKTKITERHVPTPNQNVVSILNSSRLLKPNANNSASSKSSNAVNHVKGAAEIKINEVQKVKVPGGGRSSSCAKGESVSRKTLEPSSSTRRLRPSTRAMTAARADELLMLAKQRQNSPSPELEDREDAGKYPSESSEAEIPMDCDSPISVLQNQYSSSQKLVEPVKFLPVSVVQQMEIEKVSESFSGANALCGNGDEGSNSSKFRHVVKDVESQNGDILAKTLPPRRLLRGRRDKPALDKEGDLLSGQNLSRLTTNDVASDRTKNSEPTQDHENPKVTSNFNHDEGSSCAYISRITLNPFSLFPSSEEKASVVIGPSYHPSEEQFEDPIQYIELIQPNADQFGICSVIPPDGWKVDCCISQELRFSTNIQYINRLRHRWGPNSSQMDCIKKHLESQKINLDQIPLLNGIQVDLVALSKAVKQCDGLQSVIDRNLWSKVADMMHLPKYDKDKAQRLCQIYCRYLLSYDMLSEEECQKLKNQVSGRHCHSKVQCFAKGKSRTLGDFFNIARNIIGLYFDQEPSTSDVEAEYWKLVSAGERHVAVQTVRTVTDQCGSAFPERRDCPYTRHGWNFNVLKKNEGNLLQILGKIEDVSSSTLCVGMLFSTGCWFRHQNQLPFIHYLHTGADIIWYCIPASETEKFKKFVREIFPDVADWQLWSHLSTVMISPEELVMHGISVSRIVQKHGEYMIVFPEAFTAYVCSGYSITESLYFATPAWIPHGCRAAKVLKESSIPELFSMTKLCFSVAFNGQPNPEALKAALPFLKETISAELDLREKLLKLGISRSTTSHDEHVECEVCQTICFLSAVVSEKYDVVYCLEHGFLQLQKKKKFNSYKMLYQFEENDLRLMLERAIETSGSSLVGD